MKLSMLSRASGPVEVGFRCEGSGYEDSSHYQVAAQLNNNESVIDEIVHAMNKLNINHDEMSEVDDFMDVDVTDEEPQSDHDGDIGIDSVRDAKENGQGPEKKAIFHVHTKNTADGIEFNFSILPSKGFQELPEGFTVFLLNGFMASRG
ncbi:hypothetical protein AWENTII_002760 [Aspergillus wentii]|nr:hypothetical protein MW887_007684 [Aspergillus wentii]